MKTVLITGGSRGIGAAIAEIFAKNNYKVILNYNKSFNEANLLKEKYSNIEIYKADIANGQEVEAMIKSIPQIDVLVNNAGIASEKLITDLSEEEWDEIFDVNIKGVFLTTKYALKSMINKKQGRVINISSIWGITGASMEVAYSASKAAVIGFTKALSKEVGPSGISVNCVAPGVIDTDMNKNLSKEALEMLKEETPLEMIGTTKDISNLVYFLASEEAKFITGQIISVDGGLIV